MIRIAWIASVALIALGAFVVSATVPGMPDPVASRFGAGGAAAGWMTRENYLVLMLLLVLLVPGSILMFAGWLPSRLARPIRVGRRTVDPAHAAAAARLMQVFAIVTAAATTVFMVGVHLLVVEAHRATPPALPEGPFYAALAVYLVLLLGASWMLTARLRRWAS